MLDPFLVESCGEEDFETVPQCEGENPGPDDDGDDDDDDPTPPGGGDYFTPPGPGPGPIGPCDPGDPPYILQTGPTVRIDQPPPGVTRIVRMYPFHLAGGAPGTSGAGAGSALTGSDMTRTYPCPTIQPPDAPQCNGSYTVTHVYDDQGNVWITWSYPGESSDVSYRVEDYDPSGDLINAWQQDCEWVLPTYPVLTVLQETSIQHGLHNDPPDNDSSVSSGLKVYWTTENAVFPPGSTDHEVRIAVGQCPNFDPLNSSPGPGYDCGNDQSTELDLNETQPLDSVAGESAGFAGSCMPQRISVELDPDEWYFMARFEWNNPGPDSGPWSPVYGPFQHLALEVEPQWGIDPLYCA